LACPFFLPTRKCEEGVWLHPARLPLGGGWYGVCTAGGDPELIPTDYEIREFCNLGYAAKCPHLPAERSCDAVRFQVAQDCEQRIVIRYVCEFDHRPREHGTLEYDTVAARWIFSHSDARIQKMAECHLESYLSKSRGAPAGAVSS
jgi:hypothetical protein